MQGNMRLGVAALAAVVISIGCGIEEQEDPTLSLTGTETQPLVEQLEDGGVILSCPAKKSLVCHVPPGNPAAAHTICVGTPAVPAHLSHHPDYQGECGTDGGTVIDEGGGNGGDDGEDEGEDGDEDVEELDAGTSGDVDAGTGGEVDAGTSSGDAGVIN